ncbi:hypothetical protein Tco_0116547 [Tanacetum coccineum]
METFISSYIGSSFLHQTPYLSSSPSYHTLSGHTPPDTTDADSSIPHRFVHRSLARTPRRSEAFRSWRSAPLSTPYPSTTSESSLGLSSERSLDLSSLSSRPSRKRCRSPTASVPSPTHVLRSIAPTPADLLPPFADIGIRDVVVSHPGDGFRTMTIARFGMTLEVIEELVNRCVEEARAANTLEAKNQIQNGSNRDNGDGGNGNGENGNGGNGNPNENGRGDRPVARECTTDS